MIKIIKSILITDLDNNIGVWKAIPMIPASGHLQTTSSPKSAGRLKTISVSFKVTRIMPEMRRNIALAIDLDDGSKVFVGNNDLPAALEIEDGNTISISCKWNAPDMV